MATSPFAGRLRAAQTLLVIGVLTACNGPFVPGSADVESPTPPRFGGGGPRGPATPARPPGLDTLPAPSAPVGSTSTSPAATVWALADSAGTVAVSLGTRTGAVMPNVNCFASLDPVTIPWVQLTQSVIQAGPFCLTQLVGSTVFILFQGMAPGEFAAAVARF
ncbi:MAG TPA: hypothetical protein VHE78_00300 [Gemmatimonadaceae bacterium]|nr:hypothetical protein [Gemmatimonadaceae bacterium]